MHAKRLLYVAIVGGALALAGSAEAADTAVCAESYENAQTLMRPGQAKLLVARETLRTCMRSGCKDWMVADCSRWLGEVDARIPTVVFSARNTAGRDLPDVTVARAGGELLTSRMDGRAIEIEPGVQTFVFTTADGKVKEKEALVREGDKAQNIAVVFDAPPEELQATGGGFRADAPSAERRTGAMTYAGYATAAAGAIGLTVGTVFGVTAIAKKNAANCDASGLCDDGGPLDEARSSARIATVGFVAGGVLLAGGITMVVLGARAPSGARARLGLRGSQLVLGGSW